jgi:hypothetical protein
MKRRAHSGRDVERLVNAPRFEAIESSFIYNGKAGACFENPWRFANLASSSCRKPLSGSMMRHNSKVAGVLCTLRRNPRYTSSGM